MDCANCHDGGYLKLVPKSEQPSDFGNVDGGVHERYECAFCGTRGTMYHIRGEAAVTTGCVSL